MQPPPHPTNEKPVLSAQGFLWGVPGGPLPARPLHSQQDGGTCWTSWGWMEQVGGQRGRERQGRRFAGEGGLLIAEQRHRPVQRAGGGWRPGREGREAARAPRASPAQLSLRACGEAPG